MEVKRITIVLLLLFLLANGVMAATENSGGCWLVPRRVGFAAGMGVVSHSAYSMASTGSTLLSVNYKTITEIDSSGILYTMGFGNADSTLYDTTGYGSYGLLVDTTALYLDGYVGQNIQVAAFFLSTDADTFLITVQQALRYDEAMGDSGFDYGFLTTDTLFEDNFNAARSACLMAAVSAEGDDGRLIDDNFELIAPCMRLRIENVSANDTIAVNIELYARHNDDVLSGVSGRLNQELEKRLSPLRGRRGVP
jgi:hypothetical protein